MKLCKNCRHFRSDPYSIDFGRCRQTVEYKPPRISLVNGTTIAPKERIEFASIERDHGACGPEGKFYEYESDAKKRMWNGYGPTIMDVMTTVGA